VYKYIENENVISEKTIMIFYFIYSYIIYLLIRITYAEPLEFQTITTPTCAKSEYYDPNYRPHIAIVSHDSESVTFFQNPELGARDAGSILDIQLDWRKHYINTADKMKADIYSAADKVIFTSNIIYIQPQGTYVNQQTYLRNLFICYGYRT
jgi:hypothetical protein